MRFEIYSTYIHVVLAKVERGVRIENVYQVYQVWKDVYQGSSIVEGRVSSIWKWRTCIKYRGERVSSIVESRTISIKCLVVRSLSIKYLECQERIYQVQDASESVQRGAEDLL